MMDLIWIKKAVGIINAGDTDKMSKDGVTVYAVKNIIRIDIKKTEV